MVALSASWNKLGDRYYRKIPLYSMAWDSSINLDKLTCQAAPYGGPIATIRNDQKTLSGTSGRSTGRIYSSSGNKLSEFQWERGKVIGMGWAKLEQLVLVFDTGMVRLYNVHGNFSQFSLGQKTGTLLDCRFWEDGFVALTAIGSFVIVNDLEDPRPKILSHYEPLEAFEDWDILKPKDTLSGQAEIVTCTERSIVLIDTLSFKKQPFTQGPFSHVSVSPDGNYLALYTTKGLLMVVSKDFQTILAEYPTSINTPPLQMAWCGTDAVTLVWEHSLIVLGPFGNWIKYAYTEPIVLVSEMDGLRIITNKKSEFLHLIQESTEKVFKIGSTDPGALLYDTFELRLKRDPKSDSIIRSISPDLKQAFQTCVDAAKDEFDTEIQTRLLHSAVLAKGYLTDFEPNEFVKACRYLRVLNSIRSPEYGLCMTYKQMVHLGIETVIDILIRRHEHYLAIRICEYLQISPSKALIHWACSKIKRSTESDHELYQIVKQRLDPFKEPISYAEIAKSAFASGHSSLAIQLLEHEPNPTHQVPLLLSMDEDLLALQKATQGSDTELLFLVIMHLKRKLSSAEMFQLFKKVPASRDALLLYCKHMDTGMLNDFYYQEDNHVEIGYLQYKSALCQTEIQDKLQGYKLAIKSFQSNRESASEAKLVDEQMRLFLLQSQWEKELNIPLTRLSLIQTMTKCLIAGQTQKALKLKNDYKVSEKRWLWLQLKHWINTRQWDELEKFTKINIKFGLPNVIEALLKAEQKSQAKMYIERYLSSNVQPDSDPYLTERYHDILKS